MTIHYLNPALEERLDAVTRALDAGLPSMKEVERLADWLGSGPLTVSKEDWAEAEAALRRFEQAYDAAHNLARAFVPSVFLARTGGYPGVASVAEAMVSQAQAAKALMELKVAGRLTVSGACHD